MPGGKNNWRRGSESNRRIEVLQTSALPLGYRAEPATAITLKRKALAGAGLVKSGAGDGSRTRDFDLGKVALYH